MAKRRFRATDESLHVTRNAQLHWPHLGVGDILCFACHGVGAWHGPMARIITAAPPPTLLSYTEHVTKTGFKILRLDVYVVLLWPLHQIRPSIVDSSTPTFRIHGTRIHSTS